jgi:hypothetical protein
MVMLLEVEICSRLFAELNTSQPAADWQIVVAEMNT